MTGARVTPLLGAVLICASKAQLPPQPKKGYVPGPEELAADALLQGLVDAYTDSGLVSSQMVKVDGIPFEIHALKAGTPDAEKLVLLVHGDRFSAETWRVLGTLDALSVAGVWAVALDLPGYGMLLSGKKRLGQGWSRQNFLAGFLAGLGWAGKVIVVAAGIGGEYASPFVLQNPERIAGYVSIAGVLDSSVESKPETSRLPVLLMWGEQDNPSSDLARASEKKWAGAHKVVFRESQHACYLQEPQRFNRLLLGFAGVGEDSEVTHVRAKWSSGSALSTEL